MSQPTELKPCPFCGREVGVECDSSIFSRQDYGDRYPPEVATQSHGFQVRCHCGINTCWWHYEEEAVEHWNTRHLDTLQPPDLGGYVDPDVCKQCQFVAPLGKAMRLPPDAGLVKVLVPIAMLKARLMHGPQCAELENCADCSEALGCVDECPHTMLTDLLQASERGDS